MKTTASPQLWLIALLLTVLAGCAAEPRRGVYYPGPAHPAAPHPVDGPQQTIRAEPSPRPPAETPITTPRDWRAVGQGLDATYERGALLRETFYANPNVLLQQVEAGGAMGINRTWVSRGGRDVNGLWIEEQRFADTIIGAGVNHGRQDLIDAGLRALEWGFARQLPNGGFPGREAYLGTSYFVAAAAHSLWLLEVTGHAGRYGQRINALRPALGRAADWLMRPEHVRAASNEFENYTSRYFITAYALGLTARLLNDPRYIPAAEDWLRAGLGRQDSSGYFPERGGFDTSFQAEALVYLLRYYDHVASGPMRQALEQPLLRGVDWLAARVSERGIVQTKGNTRSGFGQERDRTGAYRRVSTVAISRALGLAQVVLGRPQYGARARAVATARQPA